MRHLFLIFSFLYVCGCASHPETHPGHIDHSKIHAEHTPYDALADARADIASAKSRALSSGKKTIVAMGANWCHDSRGFAAEFDKPRFQKLLQDHYEMVYVDTGKWDRNIDIAREFGVDGIYGSPTVFILSSQGEVLNLDTAPTWRNADSRSENEIYEYFEVFTH